MPNNGRMAFNKAPSFWLGSGYSLDGSPTDAIKFNLSNNSPATLLELTAAEANPTTGNIQEIMFAFCEKFYQVYESMRVSGSPAGSDAPENLTVRVTTNTIQVQPEVLQRSYTFNFNVSPAFATTGT